jgi:ethanolamine utilization protein EutA (predicted chaperonin)
LIDEKDKLIESLQKKLKGTPFDHPQTEEIIAIKAEKEQLSNEVLELKAKLFQANKLNEDMTKEKEDLISQHVNNEPLAVSQPTGTAKLVDYMSRVSLKEKEISQLIQEKNKQAGSREESIVTGEKPVGTR